MLVLAAAGSGLADLVRGGELERPASRRLPFRELGLALGLHGLELITEIAANERLRESAGLLERYLPLAARIESFRREPRNQEAATWTAHRDINDVMLAATLAPSGFLVLEQPPSLALAAGERAHA